MDRRNDAVKRPSLKQLTVPSGASNAREAVHSPHAVPTVAAPTVNEPSASKTSRIDRDILMTGAGCVLIIFAGLLIAGVFAMRVISDRKTPAAPTIPAVAAAASPTATDTPMPTSTPTPTEVSPYTPLPTWTPQGQKQQVVDYRGHDAEYKDDMQQIGDFMQQSIQDVNGLLQAPDVTNQNWQYKILTQTDVWSQFFYQLQAVVPPDQYQEFDLNFTKALSHFDSAANDINYALEFNEPDRLNQAKTEIATGTQMINDTLKSLQSTN